MLEFSFIAALIRSTWLGSLLGSVDGVYMVKIRGLE